MNIFENTQEEQDEIEIMPSVDLQDTIEEIRETLQKYKGMILGI